MKILMMSIGTRGDCEPFLAVGEMLRERGEDVICAFPEQYCKLADDSGFVFYSLGSELMALADSEAGQQAIGGKGLGRLKGLIEVTKKSVTLQREIINVQKRIVDEVNPDCVVYHPKATYPLLWSLETGKKSIILMPTPCILHEVPNMPHAGLEKLPVRLSYQLGSFGYVKSYIFATNQLFKGKYASNQVKDALFSSPAFYTVSPSLFKRPRAWKDYIRVVGFWERNKTLGWTPNRELLDFLDKHEKIVLVSFGSMTSLRPKENAEVFIEVLERLNIPSIINISAGGLLPPDRPYDKGLIMFTGSIPYDWIMPKMYAVVHHGGAGTTHSALKSGCATMAIPHLADQPMWDRIISESGAGPRGVPISKLSVDNLTEKLSDLYKNPAYKAAAERIAELMAGERNANELYDFITK